MHYAASEPAGTMKVLRLGAALGRYWWARSRDTDSVELLIGAVDRPDATADLTVLADGLTAAALCARSRHIGTARELAKRAVDLGRQLGHGRPLIEAIAVLSPMLYFAGHSEEGQALAAEGVALARAAGDDVLLGESLAGYLMCRSHLGKEGTAELYREAIECTRRSRDHMFTYVLSNNAAVDALCAGNITEARVLLEVAARAQREVNATSHYVDANMGWVLLQEGEGAAATESFGRALRTSVRTGDRPGLAYSTLGLACTAASTATSTSEWRRAAALYGVAQQRLDETGEHWQEPEVTYRRASIGQLREHLGPEAFEQAYARGAALNLKEAIDFAFDPSALS